MDGVIRDRHRRWSDVSLCANKMKENETWFYSVVMFSKDIEHDTENLPFRRQLSVKSLIRCKLLCSIQWVKKTVTIHSFITSTNVGRFSNFFHCCMLQKFATKPMPSPPHLRYVAALPCVIYWLTVYRSWCTACSLD